MERSTASTRAEAELHEPLERPTAETLRSGRPSTARRPARRASGAAATAAVSARESRWIPLLVRLWGGHTSVLRASHDATNRTQAHRAGRARSEEHRNRRRGRARVRRAGPARGRDRRRAAPRGSAAERPRRGARGEERRAGGLALRRVVGRRHRRTGARRAEAEADRARALAQREPCAARRRATAATALLQRCAPRRHGDRPQRHRREGTSGARSARRPGASADPLHLRIHRAAEGDPRLACQPGGGRAHRLALPRSAAGRAHPLGPSLRVRLRAQSAPLERAPRRDAGPRALATDDPPLRGAPRSPHHRAGGRAAALGAADVAALAAAVDGAATPQADHQQRGLLPGRARPPLPHAPAAHAHLPDVRALGGVPLDLSAARRGRHAPDVDGARHPGDGDSTSSAKTAATSDRAAAPASWSTLGRR